jgi:hypothetical protein
MTSKTKTPKKASNSPEGLSETIEEMSEALIAGETEKQEEQATLTVEQGESQDITADYDMIEVLDFNIQENIKSARKIIPMLGKKGLIRVLTRIMESGMIDGDDTNIKFQGSLEHNAYEICNQVELDKRGLVLKVQEESFYDMIRKHNEQVVAEPTEGAKDE